jgi:hypothetical protein
LVAASDALISVVAVSDEALVVVKSVLGVEAGRAVSDPFVVVSVVWP